MPVQSPTFEPAVETRTQFASEKARIATSTAVSAIDTP